MVGTAHYLGFLVFNYFRYLPDFLVGTYIQHVLLRNKKLHSKALLYMDSVSIDTFELKMIVDKDTSLLTIFFI